MRALVAATIEATNAGEVAGAVLAVGVIIEQQGAAITRAIDQLRAEVAALVYVASQPPARSDR